MSSLSSVPAVVALAPVIINAPPRRYREPTGEMMKRTLRRSTRNHRALGDTLSMDLDSGLMRPMDVLLERSFSKEQFASLPDTLTMEVDDDLVAEVAALRVQCLETHTMQYTLESQHAPWSVVHSGLLTAVLTALLLLATLALM